MLVHLPAQHQRIDIRLAVGEVGEWRLSPALSVGVIRGIGEQYVAVGRDECSVDEEALDLPHAVQLGLGRAAPVLVPGHPALEPDREAIAPTINEQ
ncbi:hypothetical protein HNP40_002811 [Mycobacteroides chelonae]|nr:hypothetical protein [Mycobacteroides chelonae]